MRVMYEDFAHQKRRAEEAERKVRQLERRVKELEAELERTKESNKAG